MRNWSHFFTVVLVLSFFRIGWSQQQQQTLQPIDLNNEFVFTNFPPNYLSPIPSNTRIRTTPSATMDNLRPIEIRHVSLREPQQNLLRSLRSCGLESFSLSMENNRNWTCRAFLSSNSTNLTQDLRTRVTELRQSLWTAPAGRGSVLSQTCEQLTQRQSLSAPRAFEQHLNRQLGSGAEWRRFRNLRGTYDSNDRSCTVQSSITLELSKQDPEFNTPRIIIDCRPQQNTFSTIFTVRPRRDSGLIERNICENSLCAESFDYPEHCTQMNGLYNNAYSSTQYNLGDVQRVLTESFRERRGGLFLPLYRDLRELPLRPSQPAGRD